MNWDAENPCALLDAINELVNMYREYQEHQIQLHERLHREYSTLVQEAELPQKDIEVYVHKKEVCSRKSL